MSDVKSVVIRPFGGEVSDYKLGEIVTIVREYDDGFCTVTDERGYRTIVNVPLKYLAGRFRTAPPAGWVMLPAQLTFGMRVALEEAIIRHDKDLDRVYREILDFAPQPPEQILEARAA